MEISISDILDSVTRAHQNAATVDANGVVLESAAGQQEDLRLLTRAWVSERVAPELLHYPTELISRIMVRIRQQIETIEERTARMDAGASFSLVIIQTELERFKFLVRSYLRARLAKIDAHSLHLLRLYQSQDQTGPSPLLSPQEFQYLTTHAALLERHYNASFLSSFPAKQRSLEDRTGAGGVGMVEGPDLDTAVFVRCLGTPNDSNLRQQSTEPVYDFDRNGANEAGPFGVVEVSCGFTDTTKEAPNTGTGNASNTEPRDLRTSEGERIIRMRRGEVWLVRWSSVLDAVERGECELI